MTISLNLHDFKKGLINKADFIQKNYVENYSILFDLVDYLPMTDISKVEITSEGVVMTYRRSGIRLSCEKKEYRTAPLETLNFMTYEEDEVSLFTKLLEGKKSFFDIGGNIGFYAIHAATLYPELKVSTFEPIPKMFEKLNQNVSLNNLGNRISTYNFGFSNKKDEVSFFIYPFGGVNASMVNVSDNTEAIEIKAKVVMLDDYVNDGNTAPDIIKCDVEGAEKLVLDGGLQTIRNFKPVILFELLRKWSAKFNYHPNEVLSTLVDCGYQCFVSKNGSLKSFTKMDDATTETNFFFLHNQKHAEHIKKLCN
jgi:FkbM family methyltransferase